MYNGGITSMEKMGVLESYQVKEQWIFSASEAAEMIIRVDQIIQWEPRQREDPRQRFQGD